MTVELSPYALTDLGTLRDELGGLPEGPLDDRLTRILNAATLALEDLADRKFKSRAYTNWRFTVQPGYQFVELEWPITKIVELMIDGVVQSVWTPDLTTDPADYDVILRDLDRHTLWNEVGWSTAMLGNRITMNAGYGDADGPGTPATSIAPIPENLILATIITCREWYRLPNVQSQGITNISGGGQSISYRNATIPPEAVELVLPTFKRVFISAA